MCLVAFESSKSSEVYWHLKAFLRKNKIYTAFIISVWVDIFYF